MTPACQRCGTSTAPGQRFCRHCGVALDGAADARIGRQLGSYRLERVVAQGAMGVVYHAFDERLQRSVAVKLLREELSTDDEFRERFVSESRAAAALGHPNILPVFDAGEVDGVLYIATRLVDGIDLRRLLSREGTLAAERALSIAGQIGDALDFAHSRGVVHRDVKPANVLIVHGERGDEEHVYLIDFGISKRAELGRELTATGQFIGTPEYAAPEQVAGQPLDGRADQYALGCILYESVTGSAPYTAGTAVDILHAHLHQPPPSPSQARPDLPASLDHAIVRALDKNPVRRFETCRAFVAAARTGTASAALGDAPLPATIAATSTLVSPRPSAAAPPRRPTTPIVASRRRRTGTVAAVIAGVLAIAAGGAVAAVTLHGRSSDSPTQAKAAGHRHTSKARADRAAAATTSAPVTSTERPETTQSTTAPPPASAANAVADTFPDWPAGASGYTVMLAAMRHRDGAEEMAERARTAGLDAGILRSDDHADLRSGYWVVFTGTDSDLSAARARLPEAHAAGFSDAYARHVDAAATSGSGSATGAPAGAQGSAGPLTTYSREAYEVTLPSSWRPEDRAVSHGEYVESTWRSEEDPDATILVDHTPGFTGTPENGARQVRDLYPGVDSYHEISFGPSKLGDRSAWRWEFELKGKHKIDWFLTGCDTGYALLGQAPTRSFDRYQATFKQAAASLAPQC